MTNNTQKYNEKKKRPARQQGVSSIKHYYKIQNLEGILETFFFIIMPVRRVSSLDFGCKDTNNF